MARPKININWEQVNQMCGIQCTGEEIAGVLGISYDTLQRRCEEEYDMGFAEYFKTKQVSGKASLRRKQYQKAMEGNVAMLIWLGKNWLGQSDSLGLMTQDIPAMVINVQKDEPAQASK